MDSAGRFSLGSGEFTELIGAGARISSGRPWTEINAELGLDPAGRVAQAVASHETWSNIAVSWPIEGDDARLVAELSGLPIFDHNRDFRGYRGFGVCRDVERINALVRERRERPADIASAPQAPPQQAEAVTPDKLIATLLERVPPP